MCESGLRTISTVQREQEATERWFFCVWNPLRKVFSHFFTQSESIYINLLMRVQMWVYPGSIMFVPIKNLWRVTQRGSERCEGRTAKLEAKAYKRTDGEGMFLLVHPQATLGRTYLYFKNERTQNMPEALFCLMATYVNYSAQWLNSVWQHELYYHILPVWCSRNSSQLRPDDSDYNHRKYHRLYFYASPLCRDHNVGRQFQFPGILDSHISFACYYASPSESYTAYKRWPYNHMQESVSRHRIFYRSDSLCPLNCRIHNLDNSIDRFQANRF